MKNTINVIMLTLTSLILIASIVSSCISLSQNTKYIFAKKQNSAPVDAFVLVSVTQKMLPVTCKSETQCIDCKKLIEILPVLSTKWTGSGMLVETNVGPAILTAAHVCRKNVVDELDYKGIKIGIGTNTSIEVFSTTRGAYTTKIIRIDLENDLCLLKPSKIFTNPVIVSKTAPRMGDIVHAIAAPFGIFGDGMSLIFTGHYSGNQNGKSFYTIPTRPGTSGSSVLNEKWEVVGVIHTAFIHFETVGVGADFLDVRNFLFPMK